MIEDGKPAHWPKMQNQKGDEANEQTAVKKLAAIRKAIIAYYQKDYEDWRLEHAESADIVDVVNGLIADSNAAWSMFYTADSGREVLIKKIEKLKDDLAESRRPFTAQMEMQNRRIIALQREVDKYKFAEFVSAKE